MDDLVAPLVAEEPLDLARVHALDLLHFTCRVVDEAARELAAIGRDAADAIPDPERAFDGAHAGGQEAPAPFASARSAPSSRCRVPAGFSVYAIQCLRRASG